ncbi:vomeronasal type-2 receptor 26-like [Bombina bombina]|uniref:vomeronasal type-2 receptor 26-like n=1 Tax=Bombina bombina TaxID=8345 RepID=UPI00235A6922|nr:vomeronasal type-2 receptor 26-like [Bombina bombina]
MQVRRIVSDINLIGERLTEMGKRFKQRGYPGDLIDKEKAAILKIHRASLLKDKTKVKKILRMIFVNEYSPWSSQIQRILHKHWHILQISNPDVKEFENLPMATYRRGRNLKDTLVKADVGPKKVTRQSFIDNSENCQKCLEDQWPNEKKDKCVLKIIEFLSYTNDTTAILLAFLSVILALLTILVFGFFVCFIDTPIVKANNRNLSFLLLISIMLSYLCVFLFLGRPVDITCMLRQISFGISFSVAVSSLLAKTIMVGIAFKATKPGSCWRKWVTVKLSYSLVICLSSIQGLICVVWLTISPPYQEYNMHSEAGKIIIQCNEGSTLAFYSVLGYMFLLAAASFITAFYTRKLPDSFNETKFITFSMLVFCSVWIAMIPAYLSTKGKQMVAVEIFALLASNTGLLGCIFLPKCFIILLL